MSSPRITCTLFCGLLLLSPTTAQWSSSPSVGLAVADGAGQQTQAKIHATEDGGCYASWFDSDPSGSPAFGYDVRLQRLDGNGVEQWPHGGILIADRGFSSTQDYDLDVDAAGSALLTFRDDRSGSIQITATKVDPSGTQMWGGSGVQLTAGTSFVAAPKIAGTTDGYAALAWTQDQDVVLQKLDLYGNALWGGGVVLAGGAADHSVSDLIAADNGSVIVSWVRSTGFPSPRHLYANKLSTTGVLLWGASHVAILDSGSLQFGNFPSGVEDGNGGAVYAFYTNSPSLQCFAQHLVANGTEVFPHNGLAVSTNASQLRVNPSVGYDVTNGETYVFWHETSLSQSQDGVSGQRLDGSGNRLWGAGGLTVLPLSATNVVFSVTTLVTGSGAQVAWIDQPAGVQQARGARFDAAGTTLCAPFIVSSPQAGKSRLVGALSSAGVAHYLWQDDRSDVGDVYAQNVNPDCSLGGVYAGTGEDLTLLSGVAGILSAADVTVARGGDLLGIGLRSPGGTFATISPFLFAQSFATGSPPPSLPGLPAFHVNPYAPGFLIILDATNPGPFVPLGLPVTLTYVVPSGLSGLSLMVQGAVVAGPLSGNGVYSLTDGHEIRFIP